MTRNGKLLLWMVLLVFGGSAGFAYSYLSRARVAPMPHNDTLSLALRQPHGGMDPAAPPAPAASVAPAAMAQPMDPVSALAEAAASEDPVERAVAIAALGRAPAARALPILRRVMASGELVDRPYALAALGELALAEGDAAGSIREALRIEASDGNDEAFAQDAQAMLAELDERLIALR